eukprot:6764957-Prymnesium_polylepis.1
MARSKHCAPSSRTSWGSLTAMLAWSSISSCCTRLDTLTTRASRRPSFASPGRAMKRMVCHSIRLRSSPTQDLRHPIRRLHLDVEPGSHQDSGERVSAAIRGSEELSDVDRRSILHTRFVIPHESTDLSQFTHSQRFDRAMFLDPVVPGVPLRLNSPLEVQHTINEDVVALLALRLGLKAATPVQIARAAARLLLPSSIGEIFRRLADPGGYGVRAPRW